MSVAALLTLCGWIAWAMPAFDAEEARKFDAATFWCAVVVGIVACSSFQAIAALSRKTKKDLHE